MIRRLLPPLLLVVLSLALCEGALQVASAWSLSVRRLLAPPWRVVAPTVYDPRLITRGNPLHWEHDSAGYHNPERLQQADVVILGDSHAYGRDAWPEHLRRQLGRSVYNMALPGHGPGQSLLQLEEALKLRPQLVIVAPYFGNDFFDTYLMTRRHPSLAAHVDRTLLEDAAVADRRTALIQEVGAFFLRTSQPPAAVGGVRAWVSRHAALYGLLRAIWAHLSPPPTPAVLSRSFERAAAALTPEQRRQALAIDAGGWRTILTPAYRGRVLDDRDPRIRVGFESARAALLAIDERCRAAGVATLVALLPTKESVFWPRVRGVAVHPALEQLVTDETRLRGELTAALEARGIHHVDLLAALQAAAVQPYFEDVDGHPNAAGHAIIATVVGDHVRGLLSDRPGNQRRGTRSRAVPESPARPAERGAGGGS